MDGGWAPTMDDENNGKIPIKMDDLGVPPFKIFPRADPSKFIGSPSTATRRRFCRFMDLGCQDKSNRRWDDGMAMAMGS